MWRYHRLFSFFCNKILHIPRVGVAILITYLQINHLLKAILHVLIAFFLKSKWNVTKLIISLSMSGIILLLFKGATKLYIMHYSRVDIISFSTHLYKSAFSTYSFCKTRFLSFYGLVFHVSTYLVFSFHFFPLYVLDSMSSQKS